MARIKHIQRRLENWAIWSSRGAGGGRGFATKSVLASEVWSRGSYNNVPIPVFEEEAAETDKAVSALKLGKGHLFVTIDCIYLFQSTPVITDGRTVARLASSVSMSVKPSPSITSSRRPEV